jgi:hypothetical protein
MLRNTCRTRSKPGGVIKFPHHNSFASRASLPDGQSFGPTHGDGARPFGVPRCISWQQQRRRPWPAQLLAAASCRGQAQRRQRQWQRRAQKGVRPLRRRRARPVLLHRRSHHLPREPQARRADGRGPQLRRVRALRPGLLPVGQPHRGRRPQGQVAVLVRGLPQGEVQRGRRQDLLRHERRLEELPRHAARVPHALRVAARRALGGGAELRALGAHGQRHDPVFRQQHGTRGERGHGVDSVAQRQLRARRVRQVQLPGGGGGVHLLGDGRRVQGEVPEEQGQATWTWWASATRTSPIGGS